MHSPAFATGRSQIVKLLFNSLNVIELTRVGSVPAPLLPRQWILLSDEERICEGFVWFLSLSVSTERS